MSKCGVCGKREVAGDYSQAWVYVGKRVYCEEHAPKTKKRGELVADERGLRELRGDVAPKLSAKARRALRAIAPSSPATVTIGRPPYRDAKRGVAGDRRRVASEVTIGRSPYRDRALVSYDWSDDAKKPGECAWCGVEIPPTKKRGTAFGGYGRPRKFCSATCRKRHSRGSSLVGFGASQK